MVDIRDSLKCSVNHSQYNLSSAQRLSDVTAHILRHYGRLLRARSLLRFHHQIFPVFPAPIELDYEGGTTQQPGYDGNRYHEIVQSHAATL